MRNITDFASNEEEHFNLEKEIHYKKRLLRDFCIYGNVYSEACRRLDECTNQEQLDNVMRDIYRQYL